MGDLFFTILGGVCTLLLQVLLSVLFIPLGCIVWTPVLLIQACFGPGSYGEKLKARYRKLVNFLRSKLPDDYRLP